MKPATRVGVYGGAFDPPHNAHLAVERAAVAQLGLDALHLLPTGEAWHKSRTLTAAEHRLAMARLAFADEPKAIVDDREILRDGPTYTIDTLRELLAEQPGAELFLVMGEDQALALTQWREWEEIVRVATLALAPRPDAGRHATLRQAGLPANARIVRLALPSMAENATDIRRRSAAGEDISSLVPPGVAGYIARHHLYR